MIVSFVTLQYKPQAMDEVQSWLYTLVLLVIAVFLFYCYVKSFYCYWKIRGVPCASYDFFFGSTRQLFLLRNSFPDVNDKIYKELSGHRYGGFYVMMRPFFMVRDPTLIRRIMVDDFKHFHDRVSPLRNPLCQHLITLGGPVWRELRLHLSGVFSPSQTKRMFFLVEECCQRMLNNINRRLDGVPHRDVELKEGATRFTTDVIGMCALGIECGSMNDPKSQFSQIGKQIFEVSSGDALRKLFIATLPALSSWLQINPFSGSVVDFFKRIVDETMSYRKKTGLMRDDLIYHLMRLKETGLVMSPDGAETVLTDDILVSQVFFTFIAGFEMVSTTLSFLCFELAINLEVQNKARFEVDAVLKRHGGKISYEALEEMTYLDLVVAETLRLYPSISALSRVCTTPYRVPGSDVILEEGTRVVVPIFSLHRDEKYFEDPLAFRPERFINGTKSPAYLPFGDGPRICLGQKFGVVEVKAAVATVLTHFELTSCPRTTRRPVSLEPGKILLSPANGLWVRSTRRTWMPVD